MDIFKGRASNIDFEDLMDFLQYVFGMDGREESFAALLPKIYKDSAFTLNSNFVVAQGGKLRSAVGAYPAKIKILDDTLSAVGIGNVATHPMHGKKGYMKEAMTMALEAMIAENADFSMLGGQRQRYAYYGFEPVGSKTIFTVEDVNLRHFLAKEASACTVTVKEVGATSTKELDEIFILGNTRPYHANRARENLFDLLCSWNQKPFAFYLENKFIGYMVKEKGDVSELLLTNTDLLPYALAAIKEDVKISVPDFETELLKELFKFAEEWNISLATNVCVFNYKKVISALLKLKSTYQSLCDFTAVFRIEGIKSTENIKISVTNGIPLVEICDDTPNYTFSHLEAMQTFFAPGSTFKAGLAPEIAAALPLPLYIYSCDNV